MNHKKDANVIDRAFKSAMQRKSRKRTFLWILVCLAASVVISLVINYIPIWYQKFVNYNDPFYRPMDIERKYYELEQQRSGSTRK